MCEVPEGIITIYVFTEQNYLEYPKTYIDQSSVGIRVITILLTVEILKSVTSFDILNLKKE